MKIIITDISNKINSKITKNNNKITKMFKSVYKKQRSALGRRALL
jgi:hypothetical protein